MADTAEAPLRLARQYRLILDAMARPGRVVELSECAEVGPLDPAAAALIGVLSDRDAPVWLAPSLLTAETDRFLRFETGAAALDDAAEAAFLIGDWASMAGLDLALGTPEYPDRSATLVLSVQSLATDHGVSLSGPGIETVHFLDCGLPDDFWAARAANHALYPLGWDVVLTCGARLAALPRTTVAEG